MRVCGWIDIPDSHTFCFTWRWGSVEHNVDRIRLSRLSRSPFQRSSSWAYHVHVQPRGSITILSRCEGVIHLRSHIRCDNVDWKVCRDVIKPISSSIIGSWHRLLKVV